MRNTLSRLLSLSAIVCFALSSAPAWAEDAVSATYVVNGLEHTWTNISATVTKNNKIGGDGLYFVAGSGDISTDKGVVNIKEGRIMYVQVPSATSTGKITIFAAILYHRLWHSQPTKN